MLYTLTVNGKSHQIESTSAECVARSEMCWYGFNTLLIVTDEHGKVYKYRKIKSNSSITGYTDLMEEYI